MNPLQKLNKLNNQWDWILKSENAFDVSLELKDHWGSYEETPIDGHIILYGKVFEKELEELLDRALEWSEERDNLLIRWIEGRK